MERVPFPRPDLMSTNRSANQIIFDNMPEGIKREKTICPHCQSIVMRTNYCNTCGNKLPS